LGTSKKTGSITAITLSAVEVMSNFSGESSYGDAGDGWSHCVHVCYTQIRRL